MQLSNGRPKPHRALASLKDEVFATTKIMTLQYAVYIKLTHP